MSTTQTTVTTPAPQQVNERLAALVEEETALRKTILTQLRAFIERNPTQAREVFTQSERRKIMGYPADLTSRRLVKMYNSVLKQTS